MTVVLLIISFLNGATPVVVELHHKGLYDHHRHINDLPTCYMLAKRLYGEAWENAPVGLFETASGVKYKCTDETEI